MRYTNRRILYLLTLLYFTAVVYLLGPEQSKRTRLWYASVSRYHPLKFSSHDQT